jgi:hypothetical protein
MKIAALKKALAEPLRRLRELDQEGTLAAPIDLDAMFPHGIKEMRTLTGGTVEVTGKAGTVVTGSVKVRRLVVRDTSLVVMGDVAADLIDLTGSVLILGQLSAAGEVRGRSEPHVLTVLGKVATGRAIMESQYVMQFLGGGTIDTLIDTEGGGEELLELLREAGSRLKVGRISNDLQG